MKERARQIAVIGSGGCGEETEAWRLAEEVGRRLAEAGVTVVCGGRGGVMEAASRGAAQAGGEAIGVVPGGRAGHDPGRDCRGGGRRRSRRSR
ncbi:MAG TPA: DNA-processing protein DprA [Solirubrobacterales bacterium]